MQVQQLYTNCLSEAAYFIYDGKEAAVVDPLRDIDAYLDLAKKHKVKIKYILETHFHADFVSGHLELAKATGATIVYGPNAKASFPFHLAKDGEQLPLGDTTITILHTPGHTVESTCFLLSDKNNKPYCVFTGDTLFVGSVGRPDLFSGNLDKEELAAMLYQSLNTKIKTLPYEVIVYPGHGPGSACGKNLGKETVSTIGEQVMQNYALQEQTQEAFIKEITTGLGTPPAYFPINAAINSNGYKSLVDFKATALTALSADEFKAKMKDGALVLDTRPSSIFTEGFVPSSISVGLDGRFAEWAGSILPYNKDIILVTEEGKEEESVIRLARVGLDSVKGYLKGSYAAWKASGYRSDMIIDIDPEELVLDIKFDDKLHIVDVRSEKEYTDGHIADARSLPLNALIDPLHMSVLEEDQNLYVHCAGGYRSVIACSILKREGFHNLRNILGGYAKIKEEEGLKLKVPVTKK